MVLDRVRIYEDVVEVHVYESTQEVSEQGRHESLECSRSVTVSLLHHQAHERSVRSGECGLPYIFHIDTYLFIRV